MNGSEDNLNGIMGMDGGEDWQLLRRQITI